MSRWDPKERRAREEEKRLQREEARLQREQEQDTAGKTETFATRNVKTITFICCIVVFLAFFGPWSVFRMMDWIEEKNDTRIEMTLTDVVALSEQGAPITLADLRKYKGDEDFHEEENEVYYMISLKGGHTLLGVFNYNSNTMRYLTLVTEEGLKIDVLTEDVRAKLNLTNTGTQE